MNRKKRRSKLTLVTTSKPVEEQRCRTQADFDRSQCLFRVAHSIRSVLFKGIQSAIQSHAAVGKAVPENKMPFPNTVATLKILYRGNMRTFLFLCIAPDTSAYRRPVWFCFFKHTENVFYSFNLSICLKKRKDKLSYSCVVLVFQMCLLFVVFSCNYVLHSNQTSLCYIYCCLFNTDNHKETLCPPDLTEEGRILMAVNSSGPFGLF